MKKPTPPPNRLVKGFEPLSVVRLIGAGVCVVLTCAAAAGMMTITAARLLAAEAQFLGDGDQQTMTISEGPREVELDTEAAARIKGLALETVRAADERGLTDRFAPYRRWFPAPVCTEEQEEHLRCLPVAWMRPPLGCDSRDVARARQMTGDCTSTKAAGNPTWWIDSAVIEAQRGRYVWVTVDLAQFVEPIPETEPDASVHRLPPSSDPANPRDPRKAWRGRARCMHDTVRIALTPGDPLYGDWLTLADELLEHTMDGYRIAFGCSEDHGGEYAGAMAQLDEDGNLIPRGSRSKAAYYVGVACRASGARVEGRGPEVEP
jgi:hypothetical protein